MSSVIHCNTWWVSILVVGPLLGILLARLTERPSDRITRPGKVKTKPAPLSKWWRL